MEVLDFYTQEKNVLRIGQATNKDAHFSILTKIKGVIKELTVFIPKHYTYVLKLLPGKHVYSKVREYNILIDYLLHNKKDLMKKWNLEELIFNELLLHIKLCLDMKYAKCNFYRKGVLIGKSFLNLLIFHFKKHLP